MPEEIYDIGDKPRIATTFMDISKALTDPQTVTCHIRTPSGATTSYTYGVGTDIVKESTGVYYIDVLLTEAGTWGWKFNGTESADQGRLIVRPSLA